jgi:hypothetical protein
MPNSKPLPQWALNHLNLTDGVLSADRTAVIGRPNAHLSTVLNTGSGARSATTVYLSKFPEVKKRLEDEGF